MSGMLPTDNALEQQSLRNGCRDCQTLNMHNILDTRLNGAKEVSIGVYKRVDVNEVVASKF